MIKNLNISQLKINYHNNYFNGDIYIIYFLLINIHTYFFLYTSEIYHLNF